MCKKVLSAWGWDGCVPAIHFVLHLSAKVVGEPLAARWKPDPAAISAAALNEGANFRRKPSGKIYLLPEVSRSPAGDLPVRILVRVAHPILTMIQMYLMK